MLPRVVIKTCTCRAPVLKEEENKNLARVLAYQLDYSKYFACHASRLLVFTFSSQLKSRNPLNELFSAIVYLKSVNLNKFKISVDYRRLRINSIEWPYRHV